MLAPGAIDDVVWVSSCASMSSGLHVGSVPMQGAVTGGGVWNPLENGYPTGEGNGLGLLSTRPALTPLSVTLTCAIGASVTLNNDESAVASAGAIGPVPTIATFTPPPFTPAPMGPAKSNARCSCCGEYPRNCPFGIS